VYISARKVNRTEGRFKKDLVGDAKEDKWLIPGSELTEKEPTNGEGKSRGQPVNPCSPLQKWLLNSVYYYYYYY